MAYASFIGRSVKRKEDPRLITGSATYVGDLQLPGMHHVAFVRSPYPHATIRGLDISAAEKIPGVITVITGQDLAPHIEKMPMVVSDVSASPEDYTLHTDYALGVDRVRYAGTPVAAVIATEASGAEEGANAIIVDWEVLPSVTDLEQALADNAPTLFDDMPNNLQHTYSCKTDSVEAAFGSADHIVRQRMKNQRLAGVPLEGRAVLAAPEPGTGGLIIWTSTQAPHLRRTHLARTLRMPINSIRVIAPEVGGGFGLKIATYPEDVVLAALAREYQFPVRWVEARTEHMIATTHGRSQIADVEVAVKADGTISGFRLHAVADLGAYPIEPVIPDLTGLMAVGVYNIPDVDIEVKSVFTHTTPVAAYRGAGRPEAAYYIERAMDLVAAELGMDPGEVRCRNFIPPDAFPHETPTGQQYDSGEYNQALARVQAMADYDVLRAEQAERAHNSDDLLGIGTACYVEMCGFGPYESAEVRVEPDGTVTVFTGISPHGQGQETTFAQIVADELGADFDKIIVRHGDTATTPMGVGTMGSRALAVGGTALFRATGKVRDKARRIAAHILEAAEEDVVLLDGRYQVRGAPDHSLDLGAIASRAYSVDLPDDIDSGLEATDFFRPKLVYPFGAHIAVVEVERETGFINLRDYFAVDDCGPRISPNLVEGQIHGGLAQGIAQALQEEIVYDGNTLVTGSLMDYAVPRADQFPTFVTDGTYTRTPHNPLGAKGIGEAATIGSTPAVVNAVMDALKPFGVRHIDMPLRPEKVWHAMQTA